MIKAKDSSARLDCLLEILTMFMKMTSHITFLLLFPASLKSIICSSVFMVIVRSKCIIHEVFRMVLNIKYDVIFHSSLLSEVIEIRDLESASL